MRLLPFALLLAAAGALAAGPERTVWKSLDPAKGARSIKIVVEEKPLTYYAIDGEGASVTLKGPTRLRLQTRPFFAKDAPETVEYTLTFTRDGEAAGTEKISGRRSRTSRYMTEDGSVPGARATTTLEVPDGTHTYVIKSDAPAHAAFSRATRKKRALRTEMTPTEFDRAVEEVYQERERTWFFASGEKPVALEVVGPTTLDICASLNFDASMRTTQTFTVEALLDGKVAEEKTWKCGKSHVRSYPDEKELVPGQQQEMQVVVPGGRHRVELRVKGEKTGAFRILIPTKDLANGSDK